MVWAQPDAGRTRWGIALILVFFVALGLVYSNVNPIFEAPDEIQHFFFVKHLADGYGLPVQGALGQDTWSQEGSQPPLYYGLAALLIAPVNTEDTASLLWENIHANIGDPLNPANKNRIVHTEREAWPYRGAVLAVHLVRWLSLLMGAGAVWLTFQIARCVFPGEPALALTIAAMTAFVPQFIFVSSAVSNDNLITLLATLAIWLLLRSASGPRLWFRTFALGLVLGLAALTKLSGLNLWLLVGIAWLAVGLYRRQWRKSLLELAVIFGVALAVAGWWYLRNWRLYGDPTGLNQMLAVVGRRDPAPRLSDLLSEFQSLRISYWALFGWFNQPLPDWIYRIFDVFSLAALGGLLIGLLARRRPLSLTDLGRVLLPLGWILLMLSSLVRWTTLTPGTQGRLLYPAAWAINLLLMLGWSRWAPVRWRPIWSWAPIAPLLLLAVVSPFAVIRPAFARPALIVPAAVPAAAMRPAVQHGDLVRAVGGVVEPATANPGDTVWVTVYWEVLGRFERDYSVFVHLLDSDGESVAEANSWPGLGNYPTRLWAPGSVIVDRYPVRLPWDVAAPQVLRADVGFFWPLTGEELAKQDERGEPALSIVASMRLLPHQPATLQPGVPLSVDWPEEARLTGYDRFPAGAIAPGGTLELTLYWQALATISEDYAVLVHLRGADGENAAYGDGLPLGGAWPTWAWEPGQTFADPHPIETPADLPAGRYSLWVGLYRPEDGERLEVNAPSQRVEDRAIYLEDVVVSGE